MIRIIRFILHIFIIFYPKDMPSLKPNKFIPRRREVSSHNSIIVQLSDRFEYSGLESLNQLTSEKSDLLTDVRKVLETYNLIGRAAIPVKSTKKLVELEKNVKRVENRTKRYVSLSCFWRIFRPKLYLRSRKPSFNIDKVILELYNCKEVVFAYEEKVPINPSEETEVIANPYRTFQGYRSASPLGIGVDGLDFENLTITPTVTLIDVEQSWNYRHEDIGLFYNSPITGKNRYMISQFSDHGTAVMGIINALDNDKGILGIAHYTDDILLSSHYRGEHRPHNVALALEMILEDDNSSEGSIVLIEVGYPDKETIASRGSWPVEVNYLDQAAIILLTDNNRIVIEAAGNAGLPLDDLRFEKEEGRTNFPDRLVSGTEHFIDSGAIFVGAANPNNKMNRWNSSNHGSRVDCFAWGVGVTTAGYYQLDTGGTTSQDDDYTNQFGGTSAAAAIIASVALIVQDYYISNNLGPFLTPREMRDILSDSAHGTPQGTDVSGNIGIMPDLKKILDKLGAGYVS